MRCQLIAVQLTPDNPEAQTISKKRGWSSSSTATIVARRPAVVARQMRESVDPAAEVALRDDLTTRATRRSIGGLGRDGFGAKYLAAEAGRGIRTPDL